MRASYVATMRRRLRKIAGMLESPGTFYEDDAFWVNAKEIAHFHDGAISIRITRPVFSAHRDRLRADPRVSRRSPASDWITVQLESPKDVDFAAELAQLAADAHRPAAGVAAKPPPTGADLERRRRFH
ncbi:MAG: luciferase family protein [Dehalococcoidia bacterium]